VAQPAVTIYPFADEMYSKSYFYSTKHFGANVNMHILFSVHKVAQTVICVCCIQKVPAFSFGPETWYPDQSILQFPQTQQKPGIVSKTVPQLLSHTDEFINHK
jgi:hypothetical protein